jgi:N-acetylmuramoyl-L-alanine amidase
MNKAAITFFLGLCLTLCGIGGIQAQRNFVIAIDIGHSPTNPGATSARGVSEYNFNRNIAVQLLQRLQSEGFRNTFIITEKQPGMGLFSRASIASARADLLLSIHHDSAQPQYLSSWIYNDREYKHSDLFNGYSLFISKKNPQWERGLLFSQLLGDALLQAGIKPTLHHAEPIEGENRPLLDSARGIYQFDDLILLKRATIPAVLMECGVIVNRQEERRLSDAGYQRALVTAMVQAIRQYAQTVGI